jgi:hypothetical protein
VIVNWNYPTTFSESPIWNFIRHSIHWLSPWYWVRGRQTWPPYKAFFFLCKECLKMKNANNFYPSYFLNFCYRYKWPVAELHVFIRSTVYFLDTSNGLCWQPVFLDLPKGSWKTRVILYLLVSDNSEYKMHELYFNPGKKSTITHFIQQFWESLH